MLRHLFLDIRKNKRYGEYPCGCFHMEKLGDNRVGNKIFLACCLDSVADFKQMLTTDKYQVCTFFSDKFYFIFFKKVWSNVYFIFYRLFLGDMTPTGWILIRGMKQ